jgi:hypothetical protein
MSEGKSAMKIPGIALCLILALGTAPVCHAESAPPAGLTLDAIVASLRDNGFQAKVNTTGLQPKVAGQITTGVGGVTAQLTASRCSTSSADSICLVLFSATFTDASTFTVDSLDVLNRQGFATVHTRKNADGSNSGFQVMYMYFTEGLTDAKVIPIVLKGFGESVMAVLNKWKELGLAQHPAPAAPEPPK